MWKRSFWVIFASFSVFHLMEDLLLAVVARFTDIPILVIFGGVLFWALVSTVILHIRPIRQYWDNNS